MAYALVHIDILDPIPDILLGGRKGAAFIVKRKGRPIDFWMEPNPSGLLSASELARRISERNAGKILREAMREELRPQVPSNPLPSLTIAVCTKDRPDLVDRLLQSIEKLSLADGKLRIPPVLVVDNAPSDDRTREVALRHGAGYVLEPRPGLDFARNRALQEVQTELLAFLDDDVTVDAFWLAGLAETYSENPDAAAFTGLVLPLELETEAQILFEQRGGFRRGFEKIRYGSHLPGNPFYPCGAGIFGAGANMAFRVCLLRSLGGFDEALDTGAKLPGGGDLDIFFRVVHAGHVLAYEPRLLVFHQHRRELDALERQYESWGRGFMAFVRKSYATADPVLRARFRGLLVWWVRYEFSQLRHALRGRKGLRPGLVLAEIRGGFRGIFGEYARSLRHVEQIKRAHP